MTGNRLRKSQFKSEKIIWGDDPEFAGPQNYFRQSLVLNNLRRYCHGGYILDAGCGGGLMSLRLAQGGYRVEGVDVSDSGVRYAKNKIAALKMNGSITIRKASVTELPYPDLMFDAVVCGEVLEHVKNDIQAIRQIFRVPKPGGTAIFTVPAKPELFSELDTIAGHYRRYLQSELVGKVTGAGMKVITSFYWGFPATNIWQKYFLPSCIRHMLKSGHRITVSESLIARVVKHSGVQQILSKVFLPDIWLKNTGWGNSLFLVARKT